MPDRIEDELEQVERDLDKDLRKTLRRLDSGQVRGSLGTGWGHLGGEPWGYYPDVPGTGDAVRAGLHQGYRKVRRAVPVE